MQALQVPDEQFLRVRVLSAHHLRKVNHRDVRRLRVDHYVELVEVAVHEPVPRERFSN